MSQTVQLLRREDVQDILKISRSTFFRMVKDGRLKLVKLGAGERAPARVRLSDVESLIENGLVD